jgi:hypothetical protein
MQKLVWSRYKNMQFCIEVTLIMLLAGNYEASDRESVIMNTKK